MLTTKKTMNKLNLNRETLAGLNPESLRAVRGGVEAGDWGGDGAGAQPANNGFSNNVWNCSGLCGVTR